MMSGVKCWLLLSLSANLAACGPDQGSGVVGRGVVESDVATRPGDGPGAAERWMVEFSDADRDALVVGWAGPEVSRETGTSFTWATALTAVVRLDLVSLGSGTLHLRCEPFIFDSSVTQTVGVRINNRELGTVTLEPGMTSYALAVPADALVKGENTVTFEFAYAEAPQAHGLGDDTRPLAAAFEVVRLARGSSVRLSSTDRDALVTGWAAPEVSPERGTSFTWATALTAAVRLSLVSLESGILHLRCEPFIYDSSITQTVRVRINDRELGIVRLAAGMRWYALPVPGDALLSGDNTVTFEFAYAEAPQAHGLGDDARRLAVAFEEVSFSHDASPNVGVRPRQ